MNGEPYFTSAKDVIADAKKKHKEKQETKKNKKSISDEIATPRSTRNSPKAKAKKKPKVPEFKGTNCAMPEEECCDDTEKKPVKSPLEKKK